MILLKQKLKKLILASDITIAFGKVTSLQKKKKTSKNVRRLLQKENKRKWKMNPKMVK